MSSEAIAMRVLGQYPLSVPTSLAVESANGVHPEIVVETAPILRYEQLWVNLRTLYRNFMGSLPGDSARGLLPEEISQTLVEEMEQIVTLIRDGSRGGCQVQFYVSNYAGLELRYRFAVLRRDSTDNQKFYTAQQNKTLEWMAEQYKKGQLPVEIQSFDLKLRPKEKRRVALLTHYPYDLVSAKNFGSLDLLESHTGKFKDRSLWYTKYHDGKALPFIPFREDFLQIFGDAETFRPLDIKLRREIIEVAQKYSWSAVTTHAKLLYGIEQIPNPYHVAVIKQIMTRTA